ncbi:hypothetical protein CRG98_026230 [Punica granatum]|uniref:Uncharacterized protein n=1 Tax=Punica granatum TaxID=22663 RepID=A0A2I0JBT7_PUNGR|nr:hypothetical protein CRG98_026230 [Punica granatum]
MHSIPRNDLETAKEVTLDSGRVRKHSADPQRDEPSGLPDPTRVTATIINARANMSTCTNKAFIGATKDGIDSCDNKMNKTRESTHFEAGERFPGPIRPKEALGHTIPRRVVSFHGSCESGKISPTPIRASSLYTIIFHMINGCARLIGPRTVTNSSRGRVRVVRNPLNVMAQLADVVRRNGASRGSVCTARGSRDPTLFTAGT